MNEQPSRFHASPADIDAFLRERFAEDVLLHFYRAVGDEVLDEALSHGRQYRAAKESRSCKHVYLAGMADVMDEIWDYRFYPAQLPKLAAYNQPFNPPRENGPERECGRIDTHGAHRFDYQGRFIRCPGYDHANHVHAFDTVICSWPDGPNGEVATLRQCWCGATRTDDVLGSRGAVPVDAPTVSEWGAAKARQAAGKLQERPCNKTESHLAHAHRADRQFFGCPGILPENIQAPAPAPETVSTPCYIKKPHEPHEWLKGRRKLPCPGFPN